MITRRQFLALTGALLPIPAFAQMEMGTVHEISGEVLLNGFPMARNSAVLPGHTITTGGNGSVWFTVGGDAFFLRPRSELRLRAEGSSNLLLNALRLVTGAMGATFGRGRPRTVVTPTVTIGIRGTGVYVETNREETYACNCFGAVDMISNNTGTMMESVRVMTENHQARRIHRDPQMGMRIQRAPFELHTNEEIIRLEQLAGRPSPFRT